MEIPQSQGTTVGNNLFHSFSTFNINSGESALFTGSSTLSNIISRVTGASASTIDGALDHNMPNASFWLLNPNGILFGPNASLPTMGAFHATTADYLLFEEGGRFGADASLPENNVLRMSDPSAFGFIGSHSGSIAVEKSKLITTQGADLSLVGGDIDVNEGMMATDQGNINLLSVSSVGEALISTHGIDIEAFSQSGAIKIKESVIRANNAFVEKPGANAISIQGGELVVENSKILVNTDNDPSHVINIDTQQDTTLSATAVNLENERLVTSSHTQSSETSGNLGIQTDSLAIRNNSAISISTYEDSGNISLQIKDRIFITEGSQIFNNGGDILINTAEITLENHASLSTMTQNSGSSGNLNIVADRVRLFESILSTGSTQGSTGQGGEISVSANEFIVVNGILSSSTQSSGHAGNIHIYADSLRLSEGGCIHSGVLTDGATGHGGSININAQDSLIVEDISEISTATSGAGDGGNIKISACVVAIDRGGLLSASSFGSGAGGSVILDGIERLSLSGGGSMAALTSGTGEGGQVDIKARSIHIAGATTTLQTSSTGSGHAGNLLLRSEHLVLDQGGRIQSIAISSGNAGTITLGTSRSPIGNLILIDESLISTSTYGLGIAGDIHINATGAVTLQTYSQGPYITSSAWGTDPNALGSAGNITLNANALNILGGGTIATDSHSHHGKPANIQISVNDLLIQGKAPHTLQAVAALENGQSPQVSITGITSNTTANQPGGNITLNVSNQALLFSGVISASASGVGGGGHVSIGNGASPAGLFIIDDNSAVFARAQRGNGGNIFIFPTTFLRGSNSRISADSNQGNTGVVKIDSVDQEITGSILDLDNPLMRSDLLINPVCDTHYTEQPSRLIVDGRGVFRLSPGDYIPSKLTRITTPGYGVDHPSPYFSQ
jgi:filamentous hemagglutinin family protein